jgi:predicted ATPase/DNA-binding CsgD family transcriptional regulator
MSDLNYHGTMSPQRRSSRPTNLPAELKNSVGRRKDISELQRMIKENRLTTLNGPAGVGKSHLALRVGWLALASFEAGVWYVDLSMASDSDQFNEAVTSAFGVPQEPLTTALEQALSDKRALIILDGCDQVIAVCNDSVVDLLKFFPQTSILATSRHRLSVPGQASYSLRPLAYPDDPQSSLSDLLGNHEALEYFASQAKLSRPGFSVDETNVASIAELCRRLDGLPLAIELAAGRMNVMSPAQLLERLDDSYDIIKDDSGRFPKDHSSLKALVQSSIQLCTPEERLVWLRASVFAGQFSLEAAESVCSDEKVPRASILDIVSSLVDKSLFIREDHRGDMRYRVLGINRAFALRMLKADYNSTAEKKHAEWVVGLVDKALAGWFASTQGSGIQFLEEFHDDLIAALKFVLRDADDASEALELIVNLGRYWMNTGRVQEGRQWLNRALNKSSSRGLRERRAMLGDAWLAISEGDLSGARKTISDASTIHAPTEDDKGHLLMVSGALELHAGNLSAADQLLQESAAAYQHAGNSIGVGEVLLLAALSTALRGDTDAVMFLRPDATPAAGEEIWSSSYPYWIHAITCWRSGDTGGAVVQLRKALKIAHAFADKFGITCYLEVLACVLADRGELTDAAKIHGFVRGSMPGILSFLAQDSKRLRQQLVSQLGEEVLSQLMQWGGGASTTQVLELALGEKVEAPFKESKDEPVVSPLTPREEEVAQLIAQGLSNQDIASRFVLSRRTVEGHVQKILVKLGFVSRTQIAYWSAVRATSTEQPGQALLVKPETRQRTERLQNQ